LTGYCPLTSSPEAGIGRIQSRVRASHGLMRLSGRSVFLLTRAREHERGHLSTSSTRSSNGHRSVGQRFRLFFLSFFWRKTLPSLFLNRSTELHTHPAGQNVPFFKTLSIAFFSIRLTCRHREKRTIHAAVWGRTTHIAAWGRTIHIAVWGSTVCARNVIFLLDSSTTLPIKSYGA
jgi:hypothetical protein